jgi:hypothetical protein
MSQASQFRVALFTCSGIDERLVGAGKTRYNMTVIQKAGKPWWAPFNFSLMT